MHALPNPNYVSRFHADQHRGQRVVNQADHGTRAAARMGFAITRYAFGGFDPNNNCVALGGAANPHRDCLALIKSKGQGNCSDCGDFQGLSRVNVVWVGLWLILLRM